MQTTLRKAIKKAAFWSIFGWIIDHQEAKNHGWVVLSNIFFMFTPTCGNDPMWLICFKMGCFNHQKASILFQVCVAQILFEEIDLLIISCIHLRGHILENKDLINWGNTNCLSNSWLSGSLISNAFFFHHQRQARFWELHIWVAARSKDRKGRWSGFLFGLPTSRCEVLVSGSVSFPKSWVFSAFFVSACVKHKSSRRLWKSTRYIPNLWASETQLFWS